MRESLIRLKPEDMRLRVMAADVILAQAEVLQKMDDVAKALETLAQAERKLEQVPTSARDKNFEEVMSGITRARADWERPD